jgi:hypothetical protein
MEPANHEFVSSIAPEVMTCLTRSGYFEKLDDLLSPEDASRAPQSCEKTFKLSVSILLASGFQRGDLDDIFACFNQRADIVTVKSYSMLLRRADSKPSIGAAQPLDSLTTTSSPHGLDKNRRSFENDCVVGQQI